MPGPYAASDDTGRGNGLPPGGDPGDTIVLTGAGAEWTDPFATLRIDPSAPVGEDDGYISALDTGVVYFFAGGNRWRLDGLLDNPAAGDPGSPIGLLLALTYP